MAYYSVAVQGEQIPMHLDGQVRKMGFYTVCYLEASSKTKAEQLALNRVRKRLDQPADPQGGEDLDPLWDAADLTLVVDEVQLIDATSMESDTGFAWYIDDDS